MEVGLTWVKDLKSSWIDKLRGGMPRFQPNMKSLDFSDPEKTGRPCLPSMDSAEVALEVPGCCHGVLLNITILLLRRGPGCKEKRWRCPAMVWQQGPWWVVP